MKDFNPGTVFIIVYIIWLSFCYFVITGLADLLGI